ncbi:MAG TPA: ATP synthase subunit I [Desulfosarcina sp.]|nr:ATP synthase subunit I [Desulfosarcina sp.]
MEAIDHLQRRYGGGALAAAASLGLAAYLTGRPAVAAGLVLGALFGALNFWLLGRTLARRMNEGFRHGIGRARAARAIRCMLWAVPVMAAVKLPAIDLAAAVAGLFMVPGGILLDALVRQVRGQKAPDP